MKYLCSETNFSEENPRPGKKVSFRTYPLGTSVKRLGVIAYVIPKGVSITEVVSEITVRKQYAPRFRFSEPPRDHESYLVAVPDKTSKRGGRLFWPSAGNVTLV